jgi:hypothetical protein
MEVQILRPIIQELDMKGRISYSEANQAWNTIRFKKELLKEFPQLKEKRSLFSYRAIFYRDFNKLDKAMKKLRKENGAMPIILFMYKEKEVT